MAQVVEHILGKDEVGSSSLPSSSKKQVLSLLFFFVLPLSDEQEKTLKYQNKYDKIK